MLIGLRQRPETATETSDAQRRHFLDRLRDVDMASWALTPEMTPDMSPPGADQQTFNPNHEIFYRDPILTADPSSLFVGAKHFSGSGSPQSTAWQPLTPPDENHFSGWDKLDENRQLLVAAERLRVLADKRTKVTLWSATAVGSCTLVAVCALASTIFSSAQGQERRIEISATQPPHSGSSADTNKASSKSIADLIDAEKTTRQSRSLTAGPASAAVSSDNAAVREAVRTANEVGGASELASRFIPAGRVSADAADGTVTGTASPPTVVVTQSTPLSAQANGDIPLRLNVSGLERLSGDSVAVIEGLPDGIILSSGALEKDGSWTVDLPELQSLSLIVGADAPSRLSLRIAVQNEQGSTLAALSIDSLELPRQRNKPLRKVLNRPSASKSSQLAAESQSDREVQLRGDEPRSETTPVAATPTAAKPSAPKIETKARQEVATVRDTGDVNDDKDEAKEQPKPKTVERKSPRRQQARAEPAPAPATELPRAKRMGVGASGRSEGATPSQPSNAPAAAKWWTKPKPEWANFGTPNDRQ